MNIQFKTVAQDDPKHQQFRRFLEIGMLSVSVGILAGGAALMLRNWVLGLELIDNISALQPLLIGCMVNTLVSIGLFLHSIRMGSEKGHDDDEDGILAQRVSEFMTSDVKVVAASLPLCRLFERYQTGESRDTRHSYPVVDEEGRLAGMITRWDLPGYSSRDELGWLVVADVMRPAPITSCHPGDTLRTAAERMLLAGVGRLPVVLPLEPNRVVGILSRSDILKALFRVRVQKAA